jgi:hypothetical protein
MGVFQAELIKETRTARLSIQRSEPRKKNEAPDRPKNARSAPGSLAFTVLFFEFAQQLMISADSFPVGFPVGFIRRLFPVPDRLGLMRFRTHGALLLLI